MVLADRLKMPVQEIMQLSALEIQMWAGYITYESEEQKRTMSAQKKKGNQPRGR